MARCLCLILALVPAAASAEEACPAGAARCGGAGVARDAVLLQKTSTHQVAPSTAAEGAAGLAEEAAGAGLPELPGPFLSPAQLARGQLQGAAAALLGQPPAPHLQPVPPSLEPRGAGEGGEMAGAARLEEVREVGEVGPPVDLAQEEEAEGLVQPSAFEMKLYELTVQVRKEGYQCKDKYFPGRPNEQLKFDCRLWRAARDWSSRLGRENFFEHVKGDSTPCTRTKARGLEACSENIAAAGTTPEGTLSQWKRSAGHCLNLMDPGHNRIGIGHVATPGSTFVNYWTQSFGVDGVDPDTSCFPGGSPAPPPPPPPTCFDSDPNCERSYSSLCYLDNIKQSCRKMCGLCSDRGAPAPPPAQGGGGGDACADTDPNCKTSYSKLCYLDNIKRVCKRTCGLCGGGGGVSPPSPGGGSSCADTDPNCETSYSNLCHLDNIKRVCKRTCGLCGGGEPAPPPPSCEDADPNCAGHYANLCYLDHIKKSCARTCGQCS